MTTEIDNGAFMQLAGSKLRNRLGASLNESSAAAIPIFAKKQLEKMGWKEGEGLGKKRQGISSHIKVTKRADGLGLGESTLDPAIEQSLKADNWWKNSVGDTLAKLASKKKKKKESKKKKKIYTDEELFEATGGARFGMRAQSRQDAKWRRAESNISEQEEKEAKEKVEWDGMAAAKVVLKENKKSTSSKKRKSSKNEKTTETPEEKAARKQRKKEKKRQRKAEEKAEQPSAKRQKSKKD